MIALEKLLLEERFVWSWQIWQENAPDQRGLLLFQLLFQLLFLLVAPIAL